MGRMTADFKHDFKERRKRCCAHLPPGSIVLLPAGPEVVRTADQHYPYHQDNDFYYLTGFVEPEALAILLPDEQQLILFNRPRDPAKELWDGLRSGQDGAKRDHGADHAYSISELSVKLAELLAQRRRIYLPLLRSPQLVAQVLEILGGLQAKSRKQENPFEGLFDIAPILAEMRVIKEANEINCMRNAAEISARAHADAMRACRPGMMEYELAAVLKHRFYSEGCQNVAYPPIVGGGDNACVLHYVNNNQPLRDGDLVLIDAGGEFNHYAADITRTFPVNGRFTPEQKALYELVLAAQQAGIDAVAPGQPFIAVQEAIVNVFITGFIDFGWLPKDVGDQQVEAFCKKIYPHSSGHWLGLDVHDMGAYWHHGESRALVPGMVLTVEPGLYIPHGTTEVPEEWWGMGIRIEDDILVTEQGNDNLSQDAPKTVVDIEAVMKKK
jgi:Xaa-Pro aminopeptidase